MKTEHRYATLEQVEPALAERLAAVVEADPSFRAWLATPPDGREPDAAGRGPGGGP